MQKYDLIETGIANRDVKALRGVVGGICYTCRDFSDGKFDAMVRYVESKGIKIKDDILIGNPIISSQKSDFTDDDFAEAVFELKRNFCDERIEDVKKIGRKLYGNKEMPRVNDTPVEEQTTTKTSLAGGTSPNFQSQRQKVQITLMTLSKMALIVLSLALIVTGVWRHIVPQVIIGVLVLAVLIFLQGKK